MYVYVLRVDLKCSSWFLILGPVLWPVKCTPHIGTLGQVQGRMTWHLASRNGSMTRAWSIRTLRLLSRRCRDEPIRGIPRMTLEQTASFRWRVRSLHTASLELLVLNHGTCDKLDRERVLRVSLEFQFYFA